MRKVLWVAVFALMIVGPLGAADPIDFCARVDVSSVAAEAPLRGADNATFSVRKVEDLRFTVVFLEEVKGDHILELKVKTPRGFHYQTLTAPIATSGALNGVTTRDVPSYPRPLEVQVLRWQQTREGSFQVTELSLPVAGTSIVTSSLYGTWGLDVYMDGFEMPCKIKNRFTLTE